MIRQVSTLNVLASSQQTSALRQDNIIAIKIKLSFTVTKEMVEMSNDMLLSLHSGDQLVVTPRSSTDNPQDLPMAKYPTVTILR
jgi:hypothetical protein